MDFYNFGVSHPLITIISGISHSNWPKQSPAYNRELSEDFWTLESHILGQIFSAFFSSKSPRNKSLSWWENSRGTYNTSTLCLKLGHFQLIMDERGAGDTTDSMTSEQMTIKRIKWTYIIVKRRFNLLDIRYPNYNL